MMNDENTYSQTECIELLKKILNGYSEFLKTHLPDGWKKSKCVKFFHPTAQQQFDEHNNINENLKQWSKKKPEEKEISISDFEQNLACVDEKKEPFTLLGLCLWDIFSNNHTVHDVHKKEYDLGSFRGSARTIAGLINDTNAKDGILNYDYAEFYMGSIWIKSRGNLQPFYEYIFSVLKNAGCNWEYSFPRLGIIKFNKEETSKPEDYNPEKAMEIEMENKKAEDFQKEIDQIYEQAFEEAKYQKPSVLVLAYQKIYGELPDGHPQKNLE